VADVSLGYRVLQLALPLAGSVGDLVTQQDSSYPGATRAVSRSTVSNNSESVVRRIEAVFPRLEKNARNVAGVCQRSCKITIEPGRTRRRKYAALHRQVQPKLSWGKQDPRTQVYDWDRHHSKIPWLTSADPGRNHLRDGGGAIEWISS
jgi:hypothetical protein